MTVIYPTKEECLKHLKEGYYCRRLPKWLREMKGIDGYIQARLPPWAREE